VSPVEFGKPEPPPPPKELPSSMTPRCDDTLFKARGACIDTAAGPQARDSEGLVFMREKQSSVISSTVPLKAPVVYEFHLAHR
jgi:hypothetical protein